MRQNEDRVQQSNSAAFEVKNINAQIAVQQTRIAMANQEITNQQKMIDNSTAVVDFLKSKYINDQLYAWLENTVDACKEVAHVVSEIVIKGS